MRQIAHDDTVALYVTQTDDMVALEQLASTWVRQGQRCNIFRGNPGNAVMAVSIRPSSELTLCLYRAAKPSKHRNYLDAVSAAIKAVAADQQAFN